MAELLLLNPRKRRASKAKSKRRVRRHNPIKAASSPKRRRRNPIGLKRVSGRSRRRRNPIGLDKNTVISMLKAAAIGGAGSVAVDLLMGYIAPHLPANMQKNNGAGTFTVYDAIKIAVSIASGSLLNKATNGMSMKMAAGALTVQASEIIESFMPSTMNLGYASPANIIRGTQRVGPNMSRMSAYNRPGSTPLLSAYQRPGQTAMLSGARQREGILTR